MIDINATLIIQAFHFLCAYALIRHFLLKPIVHIVYQADHEHHDLLANLTRQKEHVSMHEQEKKTIWQLCQRYFAKHAPNISNEDLTHFSLEVPLLESPVIDKASMSKQAEMLEKVIIHNALSPKGKA